MIKFTTGGEILSAVCAGILMDPTFRLDGSQEYDVTDKIGTKSVDLDQLLIRFELFLSNSRDTLNGDISTIET